MKELESPLTTCIQTILNLKWEAIWRHMGMYYIGSGTGVPSKYSNINVSLYSQYFSSLPAIVIVQNEWNVVQNQVVTWPPRSP